jgi:hypothetical protein
VDWIVNYVIEMTIEKDHINCSCVPMVRINLGQLSMSRDMGTGFLSISSMRERTKKCHDGVVGQCKGDINSQRTVCLKRVSSLGLCETSADENCGENDD